MRYWKYEPSNDHTVTCDYNRWITKTENNEEPRHWGAKNYHIWKEMTEEEYYISIIMGENIAHKEGIRGYPEGTQWRQ